MGAKSGWDFKNGAKVESGLTLFNANHDQLIKPFENKDLFSLKAKYEF